MKVEKFILSTLLVFGLFFTGIPVYGNTSHLEDPFTAVFVMAQDTFPPIEERFGDFLNDSNSNPFDLNDPNVIEQEVEYDPETGTYILTESIGGNFYRMPTYMTFEEYMDYREQKQQDDYFKELSGVNMGNGSSSREDPIAKIDVNNSLIDRLFGGTKVSIKPQGNIALTFGLNYQRNENPILPLRSQRNGGFEFDMAIQMNVTGKIGEKLNLSTNYNTKATFDFENKMKLDYNSDAFGEDEILKKIEAGNVSFPLRSTLIKGSQSLFGLKTELKFGRLNLALVASQQKSKRENLKIEGGAQIQSFEAKADEYDENRHFFVSHYNRDQFEGAISDLPQINTLFKISKMEVWVTNDRNETEGVRDIVAIADLGEYDKITNGNPQFQQPNGPRNLDIFGQNELPDNTSNDLFSAIQNNNQVRDLDKAVAVLDNVFGFQQTKDFEKVSARLLSPSEYTYHPELGFVSINVNLRPDQVLGVSYQYDYNGRTYTVGEMSNDSYNPDTLGVLFVKMLKSTTQRIDLPSWDLMMKNIYSIGAFQVNQEDFKLDVFYEDPGRGELTFLPATKLAGIPLIQVFNLDRLNTQLARGSDGVFDFVPGVTINPRNGRIMFPVLEPFGSDLAKAIDNENEAKKYVYQQLYDSTIVIAREYPEFNRFTIRGSYKSSVSSEISLGAFNLPQNSVTVTAGGGPLTEGVDYEVDYNIGRLKILNDGILNSGVPINVSFEDNTLFSFQTKTMIGVRADYEFSKNLNVGATYLHLYERPFTQKVNIGDDPINNRIYGLDINYSDEIPWLTKAIDKVPLLNTKEPSSFSFTAEVAALKPGHSKAINQDNADGSKDNGGVVYVDDFEGSASSVNLASRAVNWVMASIPQNDGNNNNPLFPESKFIDTTLTGVNRAKLLWYNLEGLGQENSSLPYETRIQQTEVFKNAQIFLGQSNLFQTLDLHYQPGERGPYNFDLPAANGGTAFSAGLTNGGDLAEPETRWAGIMRDINTNDFQAANIEYLEFWMLDPFIQDGGNSGDLYINLGNISEDLLRDSRKFFENGIPVDEETRMDTTSWSRIPRVQAVVTAFSNEEGHREKQDVGLDGFDNVGERTQFENILSIYQSQLNPDAYNEIFDDPSNDDFIKFNNSIYPATANVFERYSKFNNTQGNSQASTGNTSGGISSSTNVPDTEDLNRDNTLNETEAYFQYKIPIRDENDDNVLDFETSRFITDTVVAVATEPGGFDRTWYRFKIPLNDNSRKSIGGIQDFRSIRFIRMYMTGFERDVTLRFARLELVRNQWRRYRRPIVYSADSGGGILPDPIDDPTAFDVNSVNVEENSSKIPFGYVLPPGILREQSNNSAYPDILQNEQALSMDVCNLPPNVGKAIYKTINLDMRLYKRLKMFVHAERDVVNDTQLEDEDLSLIVRLGSDFENNYYEYEIPLNLSDENTGLSTFDQGYGELVWPEINGLDVSLDDFKDIKLERNSKGASVTERYEKVDPNDLTGKRKIVVKGNPNLGLVKGMMVGVVNRDDVAHCAEVWINELRVNGLNEKGGFAGLARLDVQMADVGNLAFSYDYASNSWRGLEEKLAQRSGVSSQNYAAATNLELGKFFPDKSGVKIPFYAQYSQSTKTPEYDPYDLDIPLKEKLQAADAVDRDSLKKQAVDFNSIKTINFTNVRKERSNNKAPMPWDISNFTFTYGYTETINRNPIISNDETDEHQGGFDYNYSRKPTYIEPLKKILPKSKHLKLFSEFGFNPFPNAFTFNTTLNKRQQETTYRFAGDDPRFNTFFNRQFTWDRDYNVQWDLAKALKLSFNAINNGVVEELPEYDVESFDPYTKEEKKEYLYGNLQDLGRTKQYTHNLNVNYTFPFKKIPILDWVGVKAQYSANYAWNGGAFGSFQEQGAIDTLGSVIQNGQTRQVNGDFNFDKLYDKWKYLKKINKPKKKGKSKKGSSSRLNKGGDDNKSGGKNGKSNKKGERDNRKDSKSKDDSTSKDEKDSPSSKGNLGRKKPGQSDDKDKKGSDSKSKDKDKKKKKESEPTTLERVLIRPLMSLRKVRLSYSENYSTVVPGYLPSTKYFGQETGFSSPGWDFVGGLQPNIGVSDEDNDWLTQNSDWITSNVFLNQQVFQNKTQNIDAKISLEPFKGFKIDLDANRSLSDNKSLYFKDTIYDGNSENVHVLPRENGSITISYFAMNTLFGNDLFDVFKNFENNREIISSRIGSENAHPTDFEYGEYKEGYGRYQQDVLIPAFLAAYTGKDANEIPVSTNYTNQLFKILPKLNWKASYDGLSKLPMFKDIFSSFSVSHGYRSNLTINSFATDNDYESADPFNTNTNTQNYFSKFEIPTIVIDEQFTPLLGVKMKFKNGMGFNVDFKKSRNLSMSFIDYRLTETKRTEYVVGFDHRIKNVVLGFLYSKKKKGRGGRKKSKKKEKEEKSGSKKEQKGSDLNFNFAFSFIDDITVSHLLDQDVQPIPTSGQRVIRINPSIDYDVNKQLNLRLFFDYSKTIPKTSASFTNTNTAGGIVISFSLN